MRFVLILSFLILPLLYADTVAAPMEFSEFPEEFGNGLDDEFTAGVTEEYDPLSGYNRAMTGINDFFYTSILFPVARVYEKGIPEEGRKALSRFYANLHFPVRFVNNVLQLKMQRSAEELSRFVVNTTLGIGGLFDPASTWLGIRPHNEDFGQTLGHYGVGGGFHIVLPLLGPSNLRDTVSLVPDWYINPANYVSERAHNLLDNGNEAYLLQSVEYLNESSLHYREYESLKKDAVDLYPFLKNIYEQSRKKAIEE